MARPIFWPRGELSVHRFFTINLSEYAREFGVGIFQKTTKNGAWDLEGPSPLLAPEGGSVLQRQSRVSLITLSQRRSPVEGGEFSRKIRTTKERFFNIFRETMYTMLGNLRVETT